MTEVTSRDLETLFQRACFHYLTAPQVESVLFDGSALLPSSRAAVTRGSSPASSAAPSCTAETAIVQMGGWGSVDMLRRYRGKLTTGRARRYPTTLAKYARTRDNEESNGLGRAMV